MLVVDCRPGPTFGAVGIRQEGEGTRFGHWASLAELLADVADALWRHRPIRHWHPVAHGGRLIWEIVEELPPAPRSLFDLAAKARRAGSACGSAASRPRRTPRPPRGATPWPAA